jgi:hypothetical protein
LDGAAGAGGGLHGGQRPREHAAAGPTPPIPSNLNTFTGPGAGAAGRGLESPHSYLHTPLRAVAPTQEAGVQCRLTGRALQFVRDPSIVDGSVRLVVGFLATSLLGREEGRSLLASSLLRLVVGFLATSLLFSPPLAFLLVLCSPSLLRLSC